MNAVSSVVKNLLQLQCLVFLLLVALANGAAADAAPLPQNCTTTCVSPYGAVLGSTAEGIKAYSNCQSSCVIFDPNQENGTYTGIKWQCVEFTRRWLISQHSLTFGDVDVAADMWALKSLTKLSDQSSVPLKTFENGTKQPPKHGDLLIYGREYLGTGHAAIVLQVDRKRGMVRVAEQNFKNQKWPGQYARTIQLIQKDGRYWVLDPYLLGWKRVGLSSVML